MPCYEFYCRPCRKQFTVTLGADVFDRQEIKCPACGTHKPEEVIGPLTGETLGSAARVSPAEQPALK
jgi:putative FmdB family regulatory protein